MALSKLGRKLCFCDNSYFEWKSFCRKRKNEWVSEVCEQRREFGEYHHLFPVLKRDELRFYQYARMSTATFYYILSKVWHDLEKEITNWRKPISPEERLVVTIRFLVTGASFKMLAFSFRMGASTVKNIVIDTCNAIWNNLIPEHMPAPSQERLKKSRNDYWRLWNMPNCVGALDGKHCRIKSPRHSGSSYFNYRKFFSVVLQAVSDADYKFLTIDVGAKGSQHDGGTFAASSLWEKLERNSFNMPPDSKLPNSNVKVPNVLIADDAYPLKTYLLKPYASKNLTPVNTCFNYRLSRARRCIECAFGILYAKWRILGKEIETSMENAIIIIKCVCILHNIVREKDGDNDPVYRDIRFNAQQVGQLHKHHRNNRYSTKAHNVRDKFANYLKTQRPLVSSQDSPTEGQ